MRLLVLTIAIVLTIAPLAEAKPKTIPLPKIKLNPTVEMSDRTIIYNRVCNAVRSGRYTSGEIADMVLESVHNSTLVPWRVKDRTSPTYDPEIERIHWSVQSKSIINQIDVDCAPDNL